MNLLFYLTPKAHCEYLTDDESVREALERMEIAGYMSLPIIRKSTGEYRGTLTEGDLLRGLKACGMDLKKAETHNIMEIAHRRDNKPVSVTADMTELLQRAMEQNFIPVVDDRNVFIGIVTRKSLLRQYIASLWSID